MILKLLGGILLVIVLFVSPVSANETVNETVAPERPIRGVPCGADGYVTGTADWGFGCVEDLNNGSMSFDAANTQIREFGYMVFLAMVGIVVMVAGFMAMVGRWAVALFMVKGLILAYAVVYVLPGILTGWMT